MHQRSLLLALALMIAACEGEVVASSEPQTTITARPTASPATSTTVPTTTATTVLSVSEPVVVRLDGSISGAQLTLSVPDGWSSFGWGVFKNGAQPPNGMAVAFGTVGNMYTDRCQWRDALLDPPVGPTVDDLATAVAEHWGSDASAPVDVMLDGFAGKQMVLTVPTDVVFADCSFGRFQWGVNDQGGERYYQGPGQVDQWWILDVNGARLLINATYYPETSPQDRAELQAIVDSIQIESE